MSNAKLFEQPVEPGDLRHLPEGAQERLRAVAPAAPIQSLRRTGRRPYAFNGAVLATSCGVTPALPFWYEVNVFRTVLDTYVADIRLFNKSSDLPDLFRVSEHDTLEAAFDHLEGYDASGDVAVGDEPGEAGLSNAELSLRVARLQMRVNTAREHYGTVVAELLRTLEPKLG